MLRTLSLICAVLCVAGLAIKADARENRRARQQQEPTFSITVLPRSADDRRRERRQQLREVRQEQLRFLATRSEAVRTLEALPKRRVIRRPRNRSAPLLSSLARLVNGGGSVRAEARAPRRYEVRTNGR